MTGGKNRPAGGHAERGAAVRFLPPLFLIHRNKVPEALSMRVSGPFAMPQQPWEEGRNSGRFGVSNNPYPAMTSDAWAWSSGYVEGRSDAASKRT